MTQMPLQMVFCLPSWSLWGNVDKGFESAPELSRIGDDHVPDTEKTIKGKKGNAILVEGNAPRKLLSVHRRLVSKIKQNNSCAQILQI